MNLLHDIRFAFRMLRKSPAFTATAVITIALGIGATTLMFGVVRQVLLAPLPYPDSNRLTVVMWRSEAGDSGQSLNGPMVDYFSQQGSVFQSSAVMFFSPGCNLVGGSEPEYVPSNSVSSDFFRTLRVAPALGRDFVAADATAGGTAIISHRLWRDRFNSDPAIVGRAVKCNGKPFTVIGVLPATFRFYEKNDVWFTEPITRYLKDTGSNYMMIARLRDGLTLSQAQQRLEQTSNVFSKTYPQFLWSNRAGQAAIIQPLGEMIHEDSRGGILLLFGAVVLVLLIACANVAGLMVARSVGRGREIAVRSAVGATPGRLFSQLITESVVLNLVGAAAGVALALWGMRIVNAIIATRFPEAGGIHLDASVVLFAAAAAIVAGAVSGILPAWHVARGDTFAWMKHGTASRGQRRSRKVLIAGEVALAIVLLSGSALLLRSFAALRATDPGFKINNLHAAVLSLGQEKYQSTANVARFTHDAVERLDRANGVQAAAEAAVPLRRGLNLGFRGGKCDTGGIQFRAVTPAFFAVMGIPLQKGRGFSEGESAPLAVINEKLAKKCWPAGDAVGASVVAERNTPPRQIVGIVGNTREFGLARPESTVIYVPVWQVSDKMMQYNNGIFSWSIVARTSGPVDMGTLMRRAVRDTDAEQAVIDVVPVSQLAGDSVQDERRIASVMSAFGLSALLLTVVGLYALLAYYVAERTREIGVRMALGAAHTQVIRMVLREGMMLVAIGSAVGVAASIASARALAHQVAGLGKVDPWAMAAAVVLLGVAAMLASWLPARRAARVDPMVALRYE